MIRFTIPGPARGKGRPRFVKATGRTYTPEQTASYENLVRLAAEKAMAGRPPLEGPMELRLHMLKAIPASWSKGKQAKAVWVVTKPDFDNHLKIVADAMNRIVYGDDVQIALVSYSKRYGQPEGMTVELVELEPEEDLFA